METLQTILNEYDDNVVALALHLGMTRFELYHLDSKVGVADNYSDIEYIRDFEVEQGRDSKELEFKGDWYRVYALSQKDEDDYTQEEQEFIEEFREKLEDAKQKIEDREYLSLTDYEADKEWEEYLENALDDWLPETINKYGYSDINIKNKTVTLTLDLNDRGSDLASYDGYEHEEEYNNEVFYIYRRD